MPRLKLDPFSPSGVSVIVDTPLLRQAGPGYVVNKATGLLSAGTNVSLTGNGTTDSPYVINATGGVGGTVSDATTTAKGIVQLAGDLSGTAAAPTVPGLTTKAPLASPTLTGTPGISGTSGTLSIYSNVDGGEYNIGASATGKLAIFGTAANTLDVNLLDGALYVASTLILTNARVMSNVSFTGSGNTWPTFNQNTTGTASTITGNITESQVTNLTTDLAAKQATLTLTTTGTSGAATLTGGALNIPQYSGGGSTSPATFTAGGTVLQTVYNVKDFGAVGNGTTDDQTAFQSAITAAQASGGIVKIPSNFNMLVSGIPTITGNNVVIEGSGWSSKITLATAALNASGTTIGIWINGGSNIIIRNLQVDGNFTNIAKNGTYQTASTLWTPIISKYGSTSPKTYIYAGTGVDQTTYLTYRMPIRVTNASNVIIEDCFITNSISAGILVDADTVDRTTEVMIRNNRVSMTWDNGIYFHKGFRYCSAIGNHCSDTQYAGITAIYGYDVTVSGNIIHDNGPSPSDSAGIEYCGVTRGLISDNTIYNSLFEGILLKNTNETGITNGFANNYVRNFDIKISDNRIANIHDPRFSSSIAYGINIRSADQTVVSDNKIIAADYGIQVGDAADATVIQDNYINKSYGTGLVVGNSADVTNTKVIGNTIENGASSGIWGFAEGIYLNNIIRNNDQEGIDLIAPPTGVPYKTDIVEGNIIYDNGYNGVHPEAGAGNLAVIRNNQFRNSESRTWTDGVSNATTTFTSATASFAASDVGAVITILGTANSSGSDSLTTTIASVTNATTVVLATATSISRTGCSFILYRPKNLYYDGAIASGSTFTSATAKFTASDVGKTLVIYSTDGPSPSILGSYTVSAVTNSTTVTISSSPGTFTGRQFVIKRGYGRQGRAMFVSNSADVHYEGNRSIGMSTENYNLGGISQNSVIKNNYDLGSATSNADPVQPQIVSYASQNYTAYPGQKDNTFFMDNSSAAQSAFLPDIATVAKGTVYTFIQGANTTNNTTISGTSSQTINGAATYVLTQAYEAASFVSSGNTGQGWRRLTNAVNATAGSGSGITRSINTITTTTTAGAAATTDYVYFCNGTFTVTLPAAASNTNRYTIKNVGSGVITVAGTIDGGTNAVLSTQYQSIDLLSNNTSWNVV